MPSLVSITTSSRGTTAPIQLHTAQANYYQMMLPGSNDLSNDRLKDFISQKIYNFQAKIGFPLDFNATDVLSVFSHSITYFGMVRELRRKFNASELQDVFNRKIGTTLATKINPGNLMKTSITNWNINEVTVGSNLFNHVSLPSLGNKEWNVTVGDMVDVVRAPKAWLALVDYMASNFFVYKPDDGTLGYTNILEFTTNIDGYTSSGNSWKNYLSSVSQSLNTLYSSKPLLVSFLENEMLVGRDAGSFDYLRDQSSKSWSLVDDKYIFRALEANPTAMFRGSSEISFDEKVKDFEYMYSPEHIINIPTNVEEIINVDVPGWAEHFLFSAADEHIGLNTKVFLLPLCSRPTSTGAPTVLWSLPTMYGQSESNIPEHLLTAMNRNPFKWAFDVYFTFLESSNSPNLIFVNSREGYNFYATNEDDYLATEYDYKMSIMLNNPSVYRTSNLPIERSSRTNTVNDGTKSADVGTTDNKKDGRQNKRYNTKKSNTKSNSNKSKNYGDRK